MTRPCRRMRLGGAMAALLICGGMPALAQIGSPIDEPMRQNPATGLLPLAPPPPESRRDPGPVVTEAPDGAVLRTLDKMSGAVADVTLKPGGSFRLGSLDVTLRECRYPVEDPASNAYAYLTIREDRVTAPVFEGWMIANSPALNALDHARYDVWVRHCAITEAGESTGR